MRLRLSTYPMSDDEYTAMGGLECPLCRRSQIESSATLAVRGCDAWRLNRCLNCGAQWDSYYRLDGYGEQDPLGNWKATPNKPPSPRDASTCWQRCRRYEFTVADYLVWLKEAAAGEHGDEVWIQEAYDDLKNRLMAAGLFKPARWYTVVQRRAAKAFVRLLKALGFDYLLGEGTYVYKLESDRHGKY